MYMYKQFETESQGRKLDKLAGGLRSVTEAIPPLIYVITSYNEGYECSYN